MHKTVKFINCIMFLIITQICGLFERKMFYKVKFNKFCNAKKKSTRPKRCKHRRQTLAYYTVNFLKNIRTLKEFVVINLKVEQDGVSLE